MNLQAISQETEGFFLNLQELFFKHTYIFRKVTRFIHEKIVFFYVAAMAERDSDNSFHIHKNPQRRTKFG